MFRRAREAYALLGARGIGLALAFALLAFAVSFTLGWADVGVAW